MYKSSFLRQQIVPNYYTSTYKPSPNQYEVSLKIQDFRGSTYTNNRLIHRDLRYIPLNPGPEEIMVTGLLTGNEIERSRVVE